MPSEAPTFNVTVINSTAVNVSWQVVTLHLSQNNFFSMLTSHMFPQHISHQGGENFEPELLL